MLFGIHAGPQDTTIDELRRLWRFADEEWLEPDVRALVVPGGALNENLLGLSYLTRLKRFEYSNNKLLLEN